MVVPSYRPHHADPSSTRRWYAHRRYTPRARTRTGAVAITAVLVAGTAVVLAVPGTSPVASPAQTPAAGSAVGQLLRPWPSHHRRGHHTRPVPRTSSTTSHPARPTHTPSRSTRHAAPATPGPGTRSPTTGSTTTGSTTTGSMTTGSTTVASGTTTTSTPRGATGCVSDPSRCGFPDAGTAGVPAGTTLRSVPGQVTAGPGWHWDSRGWVEVDGDGAVFSGFRVDSNVDVTGDNVTISNNLLNQAGDGFGVSLRHTSNASIVNNTITSPSASSGRLLVGIKDIYGDERGTRAVGNDISHVATGIQIDSGLIQDNYIHDMGYKTGDHTNGTTSNGGGSLLTIRHNTILNQVDQTDAISLFEDFGAQTNRVITYNLVAGGGYTIYGGANPGGARTSNISITNNRISRLYYPQGGYYGPVTAFDPSGPGNSFAGNVWDDSGAPVSL